MSRKHVLIALAIIIIVIASGIILSMKKAMQTGLSRDPDATPNKTQPAPKK